MQPQKKFGILSIGLIILGFHFVGAQTKNELLKKKQALLNEIENTNKNLAVTEKHKSVSLKELRTLKGQIQARENLIETISKQIKNLNNEITGDQQNVSNLERELIKLRKEYAQMIQFAYKNQQGYNELLFIFDAASFNQAYKRLKYIQQFSHFRREQVQTIESTQNRINSKIEVLDKNKESKGELLSEQEKQKKQLDAEKIKQAQMYAQLQTESKQLKRQLGRQQREARRLNNAIQSAIRREIEEARRRAEEEERTKEANNPAAAKNVIPRNSKSSENLVLTPEAAKLSNDFLENKGRLPWPVERRGRIVDAFGIHEHPVLEKVMVNSQGITFETAQGAGVRAVFSGTVSKIVNLDGLLNVLVRHGEYFTVYGNLKSVNVRQGDKLVTKQAIGTVATDEEDGTTCQFQIWKGSTPQNPEVWLAN